MLQNHQGYKRRAGRRFRCCTVTVPLADGRGHDRDLGGDRSSLHLSRLCHSQYIVLLNVCPSLPGLLS